MLTDIINERECRQKRSFAIMFKAQDYSTLRVPNLWQIFFITRNSLY